MTTPSLVKNLDHGGAAAAIVATLETVLPATIVMSTRPPVLSSNMIGTVRPVMRPTPEPLGEVIWTQDNGLFCFWLLALYQGGGGLPGDLFSRVFLVFFFFFFF